MPIFEYRCNQCGKKFEVLHKSTINQEEVTCPDCKSADAKKLISSFSAQGTSSKDSFGGCESGSCGLPSPSYGGGCASGMCGLD